MERVGGALTLLTAAFIFGCAAVSSLEPVGERPKEISQDEWDGTWLNKNHSVTIKVLDSAKGLLQVSWVEEKGGGLKFESYQIAVRESGESIFGNVKENEASTLYYWGLIKKEKGQIIVWTPDPDQFKKLVQAGALPGKVGKGSDVILEKLTADHLKVILSGDKGISFDWQNPIVFFRFKGD